MRVVIATAMSVLLLAACGGGEPAAPAVPAEPTAPVETPAPTPESTPANAPSDGRIGTMNLNCGGESFRVAFLETHAAIVSADGTQTIELPVLPAGPTSEPGVTVYSNGMQQFAKSGGGDTQTVIRYAKGRMAWQDCAIAVN